jgi:hypothetical protein
MNTETKASWIFGSLFAAFILAIFVLGPDSLPIYKQQLLAYICALLAGCFAIFFTGSLLVHATLPVPGKWTVRGGAGFGLFLIVLFWWNSSTPPVSVASGGNTTSKNPAGTSIFAKIHAETNPSPPAAAPSIVPTNPGAVLKNAEITFFTLDDDKDHDTRVSVTILRSNDVIASTDDIDHGTAFNDNSVAGPFQIPIQTMISYRDFSRVVTKIAIQPNGQDRWNARAEIKLKFSDDTERLQTIQFSLSTNKREQTWDW